MPGGDRTGPMGMGPMTGRRAGYCAGFNVPGAMNPGVYQGAPLAGRGMGRGFRGGRGRMGWFGWGRSGAAVAVPPVATEADTQQVILQQLDSLQSQMDALRQQLAELHTPAEPASE